MEFISKSEAQTIKFASEFAKKLKKGDIVLLKGDLGAGKTHFVKGVALGLGCKDLVTSPTFTLLNIYNGGKFEIDHFDMYRLSDRQEAEALGFDEYFDKSTASGVCFVEWPENVEGLFGRDYFEVCILKLNDQSRKIVIRRNK